MAIDARNLPNILKRVGNLLPIRSGVSQFLFLLKQMYFK